MTSGLLANASDRPQASLTLLPLQRPAFIRAESLEAATQQARSLLEVSSPDVLGRSFVSLERDDEEEDAWRLVFVEHQVVR